MSIPRFEDEIRLFKFRKFSRDAAQRAAMTTTKKGLTVHVHINSKTYDIKRTVDESYQKRLAKQVIFAPKLGKWNYLIKPAN